MPRTDWPTTIWHDTNPGVVKPGKVVNSTAAGLHCQRLRVVLSGIKLASEAIAPLGPLVESNESHTVAGDQRKGLAFAVLNYCSFVYKRQSSRVPQRFHHS